MIFCISCEPFSVKGANDRTRGLCCWFRCRSAAPAGVFVVLSFAHAVAREPAYALRYHDYVRAYHTSDLEFPKLGVPMAFRFTSGLCARLDCQPYTFRFMRMPHFAEASLSQQCMCTRKTTLQRVGSDFIAEIWPSWRDHP